DGRRAFGRALALHEEYWTLINLAVIHEQGGLVRFYRGGDPMPWMRHALAYTTRVLAMSPDLAHFHGVRARILLNAARAQQLRGVDPTALLRRADLSVRALFAPPATMPLRPYDVRYRAELRLMHRVRAAQWRWQQGEAIGALLDAVEPDDLARVRDVPLAQATRVEFDLLRARRALADGDRAAAASVFDALADVLDRAAPSGIGLTDAGTYRIWQAELALLRAAAAPAADPARERHLRDAVAHAQEAVARNRWSQVFAEALAREIAHLRAHDALLGGPGGAVPQPQPEAGRVRG
ncbi:MAG: hypothetical protein AAF772_21830, partial [Acidobacteriota bacterium]